MVMKDKLVKTHHKSLYYKTRKAVIGTLCVFTFAAAIVVPTYIMSVVNKNNTAGLAEEDTRSSEVIEDNQESESSEYEEYNDQ